MKAKMWLSHVHNGLKWTEKVLEKHSSIHNKGCLPFYHGCHIVDTFKCSACTRNVWHVYMCYTIQMFCMYTCRTLRVPDYAQVTVHAIFPSHVLNTVIWAKINFGHKFANFTWYLQNFKGNNAVIFSRALSKFSEFEAQFPKEIRLKVFQYKKWKQFSQKVLSTRLN